MSKPIKREHIISLTQELATAAKIDEAAAQRVLEVLGVDKVAENANTSQAMVADDNTRRALSLSKDLAERAGQELSADNFRLDNMRLAFRTSLIAIDVAG